MTESLRLLDHHSEMIGYIWGLMRKPWLWLGERYEKGEELSVEEAVEAYFQRVIDKNPRYNTVDPVFRENYKAGIIKALQVAVEDGEIDYIADRTWSGDVICEGCYQFGLEEPDKSLCTRRK